MKNNKKLSLFILALLLFVGFILRLYRIDNPIADWHSWRQSETSSVARNFVTDGFDLLHPRMVNLSNVQSGLDNPQGYFFVEFPIYNATQAMLYQTVGIFTIEEWGRLVTIFTSLLATVFLYFLVARHSNEKVGLFTAFFYLFIPYDIYYSRTLLPEPSMVMAILGGTLFFDLWLESLKSSSSERSESRSSRQALTIRMVGFYLLALFFTAEAFLFKPFALFFTLPMLSLAFKKFGWKMLITWQLWLFAIITVAPLVWWRTWMTQFPEGIPANTWLLNGNGIRFRPSFFRWILYERYTILINGYFGVIVSLFGLYQLRKMKKEWLFFASFLISSLVYVCVVATGNVQHDYYQILIMPSVAIICGLGGYFLSTLSFKKFRIGWIILLICVIGGFYLSWQRVKDYFNINNPSIIVAGEAVDRLTPKDAKIIANYNGDTTFLYQTHRSGWASFEKDLPEMVKMGADYLVLANPTKADHGFAKDYKIVSETPQYILFDLRRK